MKVNRSVAGAYFAILIGLGIGYTVFEKKATAAKTVGPHSRSRLGTDAAKLFAATAAKEVADAAVQVLGGYGYCTEFRVEQFLRDTKLIEIGGGTLEAHQKNITRDLTQR